MTDDNWNAELSEELTMVLSDIAEFEDHYLHGELDDREIIRIWGIAHRTAIEHETYEDCVAKIDMVVNQFSIERVENALLEFDPRKWTNTWNYIKENPDKTHVMKMLLYNIDYFQTGLMLRDTLAEGQEEILKTKNYDLLEHLIFQSALCLSMILREVHYLTPIKQHISLMANMCKNEEAFTTGMVYNAINSIFEQENFIERLKNSLNSVAKNLKINKTADKNEENR